MKIAENGKAWKRVLELAPTVRKTMDSAKVMVNENKRKIKKADISLRRFAMKYSTRLKAMELQILNGMSHMEDAIASANGWYRAYRECFSTIGRWS